MKKILSLMLIALVFGLSGFTTKTITPPTKKEPSDYKIRREVYTYPNPGCGQTFRVTVDCNDGNIVVCDEQAMHDAADAYVAAHTGPDGCFFL